MTIGARTTLTETRVDRRDHSAKTARWIDRFRRDDSRLSPTPSNDLRTAWLAVVCLLAFWLPMACKTADQRSSPTTQRSVAKRSTRTSVRHAPRYEVPNTEAEAAEPDETPQPDQAAPADTSPAEKAATETPAGQTASQEPHAQEPPASQEPPPTKPERAALPEDDFVKEMTRIRDEHLGRSQGMDQDLSDRLTLADEEEIGSGAAALIAEQGLLSRPESLLEYLALIAATLGAVSDRPEVRYRVGLLESDEVNAFSLPGGFLFITRGAVKAARDEAELAAVLAHEVAHVALRHGIREIDAAKYRILMNASVLEMKRELAKHGMGGETTELEEELSGIADEFYKYARHPHSQKMEKEADRAALFYLARAGWDPRALLDFLGRLEESSPGPAFRAMSSHPPVAERLSALRGPFEEVPRGGARLARRFENNTKALRD